jgi:hypothetical protein
LYGIDEKTRRLLSYVDIEAEAHMQKDHPLRPIRVEVSSLCNGERAAVLVSTLRIAKAL